MAQVHFTLVSKGTGKQKLHLVVYVGPSGAPTDCLVIVLGCDGSTLSVMDAKQAKPDDVRAYLLDIFKQDKTTTTMSCELARGDVSEDMLTRMFGALGGKLLDAPPSTPVAGMDRLERYIQGFGGSPAPAPPAAVAAPPPPPPSPPPAASAPKAPVRPAPPPVADDDESFDSILGGDAAPPPVLVAQAQTVEPLPRLERVPGAEGKLTFFTEQYVRILADITANLKEKGGDLGAAKGAVGEAVKRLKKLLKDVTAVPPEFYDNKEWGKASVDYNTLYIKKLHLNLPEFKAKSRSEIVRLLSTELTASSKLEPESISVQFLYKNRFDMPPNPGDPVRDLLRFVFNKPLALEESFSFVTKRVDLTKLYYLYQAEGESKSKNTGRLTEIFCFRELDGRVGMVYVPYSYLGTGAVNQLLLDFFATPWSGSGAPAG